MHPIIGTHALVRGILAGIVALTAAACQGATATDRTGSQTVVLRLATIDSVNNNGQAHGPQAFVDSLEKVSGGRLRVEVIETWGDGAPDAESLLVKSIAAGELDGGWPSTRAFAGAGIDGLSAIEAPMRITSYAAQGALVTGPAAQEALAKLDGTGIVGLGLAVGPLRRPFSSEAPLLEPADWAGVRIRAFNSPIQSEVIRALGATPVNVSFEWIDMVRGDELDGAEFDIMQYAHNGHTTETSNVAVNVVLWPKVSVLSVSQQRFDALTDEQQGWVQQAADTAVAASVDARYDESTPADELCDAGVRFIEASSDQLDRLRTAVQPVVDELASDPVEAPLLEAVEAIATEYPRADVPSLRNECRRPEEPADTAGTSTEPSDFPEGVYRVEITTADVQAAGWSNGPGWSGTWTLTVEAGTYVLSCEPLDDPGKDCGNSPTGGTFEAGDVRGTGGTVHLLYNPEVLAAATGCELPVATIEGHCWPNGDMSLTWSLDEDRMLFRDATDANEDGLYWLEPWQRIG